MHALCIAHFVLFVSAPVLSRPFSILAAAAPRQNGSEDTCDNGTNSKMTGENLEQKLETLLGEAQSLPVTLSREDGNIEIRNTFEGSQMVTLAEAKLVEYHPSVFKDFFENFNEAFKEVDPMVKDVVSLERDSEREGLKVFLKFPSPVANRVMVHWKYLKLNRNKDEHLMMLSEKGNENLIRKFLTTEESEKNVLARTFLCAYWVKPVLDENKQIIGSNIRYVYSGNVGGYMPKRLINYLGPKTALNSLRGIIGYGKKH